MTTTRNLGEAAYLYALGMPFTMELTEDNRVAIVFDGVNADAQAQDYYSGAKLEAVKMIEAYKTVKSKVYEHIKLTRRVR